jgi:hypothetical protein
MSEFALRPHAPASRSCADASVEWKDVSLTSEVPKSPVKQVTAVVLFTPHVARRLETKPSPKTTKALGSMTFVEPVGWSTSTPGASSSATLTSIGASSGVSPCSPAMYV